MELINRVQQGETSSLRESLEKMINGNTDGGEILLDTFVKKNPDASRTDCVKFLKASKHGVFVTGRRKHPSRFVYGAPAASLIEQNRAKNAPKAKEQPQEESAFAEESFSIPIEVRIGDQVHKMPLHIKLGVTA